MKKDFPLSAIVAVSNPFDIWLAMNLMRGTIYEKALSRAIRDKMCLRNPQTSSEIEWKTYQEMLKLFKIDYNKLKKVETWRDYDEEFTIKVHPHFKTAVAYYNASSCLENLDGIKVPTLVIHSKDDPVIPVDCVPINECMANEQIICAITRRGGHVCFFMNDGKHRWYTHASSEFLQNALEI